MLKLTDLLQTTFQRQEPVSGLMSLPVMLLHPKHVYCAGDLHVCAAPHFEVDVGLFTKDAKVQPPDSTPPPSLVLQSGQTLLPTFFAPWPSTSLRAATGRLHPQIQI